MGSHSAARQHRNQLGEVVAIHHDRPNRGTTLGFVAAWVGMSAITLINPAETFLLAIVPTFAFLIIWVLIYLMLAGERLVVCERGILFGSVAPFLRPRAIGYEQIVPGSIVPISGKITRVYQQTGLWAITNLRVMWWSRQGISLAGPLVAETSRRRDATHQVPLAGRRPRLPETPWIIGTRAPAEQVTADIGRAARAAGFA